MNWYLHLAFEYSPAYSDFAEFPFFNAAGAGAEHSITTPTAVYSYTQLAGDGSGDIANALVALVNAGAGDPDVTASIGSAAHLVRLDPLNDGLPVAVTAVDGGGIGGGSATLEYVQLSTFPRKIAESINALRIAQ